MRPFKRIGFFLYSCALFAGGFLLSSRVEAFFYPGKDNPPDAYESSAFLSDLPDSGQADSAEQVSSGLARLSASSKMIVLSYDLDEGTEQEEVFRLPARLIGCSRAETEKYFEQLQETSSLKEREAGFLGAELLSFSPKQIVVRKNYRKHEKPTSFKMIVERNLVTVYEQETGILYLQTAVDARKLPAPVRNRILDGWEHVSADRLEKFLVSYAEA